MNEWIEVKIKPTPTATMACKCVWVSERREFFSEFDHDEDRCNIHMQYSLYVIIGAFEGGFNIFKSEIFNSNSNHNFRQTDRHKSGIHRNHKM